MTTRPSFRTPATVLLIAALLSGCTERVRVHGYVPAEEDLSQIVPGVDTRSTVEDLVGVPSTAGVTRGSGFYYIESTMRSYAYQAPTVVDRTVVEVAFDEAGVVQGVTEYGLNDGQVVPISRRVTKSGDGDIGFIRKLFGNIGGLSTEGLFGN